jgi:hypothetical protein
MRTFMPALSFVARLVQKIPSGLDNPRLKMPVIAAYVGTRPAIDPDSALAGERRAAVIGVE